MDVPELLTLFHQHVGVADSQVLESVHAVEQDPVNPRAIYRLADLCRQLGYDDIWPYAARAGFQLAHVTHQQVFERGEAKLLLGDWSGWRDRESRFFDPAHLIWKSALFPMRWSNRLWDGVEDIAEKTIFLLADGSDSDCLQLLRYLPLLASEAHRVILGVNSGLVEFVEHNVPESVIVIERDVLPSTPFDRYAWLLSLPAVFGEPPPFVPLSAPSPTPYASLDHRKSQVGLCWGAGAHDATDTRYCVPLDTLRPLFERQDIQCHGLQIGVHAQEMSACPAVIWPSPSLDTYADVANYVTCLDCVISVGTSVAHLAGTLGVPTFVMLCANAKPVWEIGRTTRWYPSVRLLRQPRVGDWASVVSALSAELNAFFG